MLVVLSIWKCTTALVANVKLHPKQVPTIHCQEPPYLVSNAFLMKVAVSFSVRHVLSATSEIAIAVNVVSEFKSE